MTARPPRRPDAAAARTVFAHATLAPFVAGAWVFSIGYEVLIGRHLSAADYGVFETLVGVLAVPGVVASGVQLLLARAAAGAADGAGAWRTAAFAAVVTTLGMAGLSPLLAGALRVPLTTLLVSGVLAGSWVLLSALRGLVQGGERYVALGVSFLVENGGRLVGTYLLLRQGYWGALLAVAVGSTLALVLLLPSLRRPLPASSGAGAEVRDLALYVLGSALVAVLPALPVLALRPALPTTAFAALAAMALLGRGEGQIGAWLTQALYPRLLAAQDPRAVFRITLLLAVAISLLVAAGAALFMPTLLDIAFAGRYIAYLGAFRLFVFAGLPTAMYGLWVTEAMAARSVRMVAALALAVPLQALLLWLGRGSGLDAALLAEAVPVLAIVLSGFVRPHEAVIRAPSGS